MLGQSDSTMILEEIRQILNLDSDDPVSILETVRKLEKVVKAVPRMEGFITNISRCIAEQEKPVPLEQIIPRAAYLRDLENKHQNFILAIQKLLEVEEDTFSDDILAILHAKLNSENA
jgi:hypothetical protein